MSQASRWIFLIALLPLCSMAHPGIVSHFEIIANGDLVSQIAIPVPDRSIHVRDLPASRPPPNTAEGWAFCDWSCLESSKIRTDDAGTSKGVYEIEVNFKPVPNITADMMVWLFQNLHNTVVSPFDSKTYPMYLLFQGVDHLHHETHPADKPVGVGSTFVWCEMPLTGCAYDQASATAPWTCPGARRGFVKSDPALAWEFMMHTKVNMTITRFDNNGIEFVSQEWLPLFGAGGDGKRTVATTRHTWQDSSSGLLLKSEQALGLMKAGQHNEFDDSLVAPIVNKVIKDAYLDGAWNLPSGNITAAGWMAKLHYLQEYGSLPQWLPQVYKTAVSA